MWGIQLVSPGGWNRILSTWADLCKRNHRCTESQKGTAQEQYICEMSTISLYVKSVYEAFTYTFNVEELKENTLSLIGAATIFNKFHVIFIKITRFCKINNLRHVLSSYIFYYEQLLLTRYFDQISILLNIFFLENVIYFKDSLNRKFEKTAFIWNIYIYIFFAKYL